MSNQKNYFLHRLRQISRDKHRSALGEREVVTLLTVLDIKDDAKCLKGKRVIDLGCGDQYLRKAFEDRGADYFGVDIHDCDLEKDRLLFEDHTFDIAISMAVLEHLYDPGNFLSEIKRVLKPGGYLWMDTPDIQACGAKFWNDPTHVHPYTRTSLQMLFEMSGMKEVLVTPNYRCKPKKMYRNNWFNFFRARYLMPFSGTSKLPIPSILKGRSTGLFVIGKTS